MEVGFMSSVADWIRVLGVVVVSVFVPLVQFKLFCDDGCNRALLGLGTDKSNRESKLKLELDEESS